MKEESKDLIKSFKEDQVVRLDTIKGGPDTSRGTETDVQSGTGG